MEKLLLKMAIMGLRANDRPARRLAKKLMELSLELSQEMKNFAATVNEANLAMGIFADAVNRQGGE